MVTWTKVVTVVVIKSGQILEIKTTEFAKRLCPMRGREVLRILLVTFPLHYIIIRKMHILRIIFIMSIYFSYNILSF